MNNAERIPVDEIVLDDSNPRIKHYLEMYTVLNEEHMLLALGAGAEDEGGTTALGSYERLKHSIRASGESYSRSSSSRSMMGAIFALRAILELQSTDSSGMRTVPRGRAETGGSIFLPWSVTRWTKRKLTRSAYRSTSWESSLGPVFEGQVPPGIGRGLQNANRGISQLLWRFQK